MPEERRKHLLLVEDEALIALATKKTLEQHGYAVQTVYRGEDAVEAAAKSPGPDLILMDIDLGPGMDGTEAAALILKNRNLPIVFFSGHTEPAVVEKTEKITSFGYVVKDSGSTVLDASIKMAFKLFAAKIGEREKEMALLESEERYKAIFDHSLDAILLTAPDGRILEANAAAERMFGRTAEEINRVGREGIVDGSDPRVPAAIEERTRTGRFRGELTYIRKDGSRFPGETSSAVFQDREGNARTSMIIRDNTERRITEQALLERNEYIETILNNMPIGLAVNTINDGIARFMNSRFAEIYGWPREVLTDVEQFFSRVYPGPEGGALKTRVMEDVMSGDSARMAWNDLKITTQTGERRYISARNIPIPDQNLMVSTVWDVTAIHESEDALREAEGRYRLLFEQSPDGVVIIDQETMRIAMFNETACRQLGYSREEFAGLPIADIEAVETPAETRAHIDRVIREGAEQFTTRHRAKDGSFREVMVWARFTVLDGRPIYHCIWRDITGKKRRQGD